MLMIPMTRSGTIVRIIRVATKYRAAEREHVRGVDIRHRNLHQVMEDAVDREFGRVETQMGGQSVDPRDLHNEIVEAIDG